MSLELECQPGSTPMVQSVCTTAESKEHTLPRPKRLDSAQCRILAGAIGSAVRLQAERGALWGIIAVISAQGVTLLTNLIVARQIGNHAFGEYCAVQNTALTVGNFACAGLGFSATRFVAGWRSQSPEKLLVVIRMLRMASLISGGLFSVAVLILANWLAGTIFHTPSLAVTIRLVAPSIVFLSLSAFQQGVLLGFRAFRHMALSGLAHLITGLCVAVSLVRHSLIGAVLAFVVSSVSLFCWQELVVQHYKRREKGGGTRRERVPWSGILASCAVPSALSGVVSQGAFWIATAIVANGRNGFGQVALFSAAFTLRQGVAFLPSILSRIAGPVLYDFGLSEQEFRRSLSQTVIVSGVAAAAIAVPLCAAAPWVLSLFGSGFRAGAPVAWLLIASGVIESVAMTLYHGVVRRNSFWAYLGVIVIWGICIIMAAMAGSRGFGAAALATGYVAAWFITCLGIAGIVYCRARDVRYA